MASHERDAGRSYASGSQKRKKKIQEEEQKKKDVGSCRKITDMLTKTVSDVTSTVESADTSDHTGSPPSIISQPASTSFVSPLYVMDISSTGFVLKDPASWPNVIPDSLRNAFIAENFSQTLNIDFRKSARIYDDGNRRCLKSSMSYRKLANSETVKRSWMVYSESSGKVYCSTKENAFTQGFND
ncbi:zinc finger MYM-type protein 5-like [Palaemon carinicauda]|uniref:zinc finger MYM-type protein 5-like n=1 Tax=Palaemon carinicauda TaxID=392227 RepID=UPI0035B6678E